MMREEGFAAERAAKVWLEKQGLRFIDKNVSCQHGEIDIIMRDKDNYLVFVEVRMRNNEEYASALESVTLSKQSKLRKTALFYLQKKGQMDKEDCRFDVVAAEKQAGGFTFDWIKDAF